MFSLENKTILITGGANGVGKALVELFCNEGACVFYLDKDKTAAEKLNNELISTGKKAVFLPCDMSNKQNVKSAIENINQNINILVNNASIQTVEEFISNDFEPVIQTNLLGTLHVTQQVLQNMQEGSKIINVLSTHADKPRTKKISYDVSKAGLLMFTKCLALELAPKKITVNAISFGAANTAMNDYWIHDPKRREEALSKVPLRHIAEPMEIAEFIVNILKHFSEHTTGSNFLIDEGRNLTP